jgi:hypothetical protein
MAFLMPHQAPAVNSIVAMMTNQQTICIINTRLSTARKILIWYHCNAFIMTNILYILEEVLAYGFLNEQYAVHKQQLNLIILLYHCIRQVLQAANTILKLTTLSFQEINKI